MADVLVSIALEKLIDVVGQQLSLFASATYELQKLSSTFQSIRAILDDAESRQASDESVQLWLSRLRHVAYDIEDLVEDGRISGLGDEEGNEDDGNSRNKLCLCFPFGHNRSDYAVSRYRIAHGIKEITERLDRIDVERNKFGFNRSTQGGDDSRLAGSQRLTTSFMDESEMFIGRVHDKELMISRLVSGNSHEDGGQAHVVAIFGIGGLGKTTFARQIYHDGRVRSHFNKLLWVCVSDVFDVIRLTKEIIEEVKGTTTSLSGLNSLQNELVKSLGGKRFLLVLDDVWNVDAKKWNMLRLPLNYGAPGSRILVTTRGRKVAETMNAAHTHELLGLSDDDSWEVFRSRAFAERTLEECSKLKNVGRQIVSKCRGVPLAITVMGSAMSSKRTITDWQNILDSKMWSLQDAKNEILPALWMSYYNLPQQLKQCFAYCSMFPKGWVLKKDMLVRLWVAQGFIQSDGNRDIEDIGASYFNDLVAWSMFQEVEKGRNGRITCKMHDLLHDLAESIAKDEIYSFIGKSEKGPIAGSNVRHSFLFFTGSTNDEFNKIPIALGRAIKLRTLFLYGLDRLDKSIVDVFHQARFVRALVFNGFSSRRVRQCSAIVELPKVVGDLKHLRYLDLSGSDIMELPESVSDLRNLHRLNLKNCKLLEKLPRGIGKMVSLRYLDLSHNSNIVELPESMSNLCNLHKLNLTNCGKLEKLPRGIGGMVSLIHLEIEETKNLKYLPKGLGRISGLRSLCKFIVGSGDEGEGCGIDELQPLNSLQETLRIQHLERVSSREEAEKAKLWNKQYLCKLVLEMSAERHDDVEIGTIDRVLEGLRPHENLEELNITGFTVSKLPSWMDGMRCLQKLMLLYGPILERVPHLPSLKKFQIWGLRNEILPNEGWEQLVALQKLEILCGWELKSLPEGLAQLPSLEDFYISSCDKLESLGEGLGQLKKLKSLNVSGSKVLTCLPDSVGQLESLESLFIRSCKKLDSLPDSLGQRALRHLDIQDCEALASLPEGVRHLSSLCIRNCPLLWERYKREEGVDWPHISHIPEIYLPD